MNIVLIGMPGCGKSTCGVLAAKMICKSFIDTDLVIQSNEGMKLQDIINTKGTEYFAVAEENAITGLYCSNAVIATGGSVVYSPAAMAALKKNGVVVYMKISFEAMNRRIKNPKTRGILLKDGETLRDMYDARVALYEKYADVTVQCANDDVEITVNAMIDALGEYAVNHPDRT